MEVAREVNEKQGVWIQPRSGKVTPGGLRAYDWSGVTRENDVTGTELCDKVRQVGRDLTLRLLYLGGGMESSLPTHTHLSATTMNNLKLINNEYTDTDMIHIIDTDMIQILPPWKHTSSYVKLKNTIREGDDEIH